MPACVERTLVPGGQSRLRSVRVEERIQANDATAHAVSHCQQRRDDVEDAVFMEEARNNKARRAETGGGAHFQKIARSVGSIEAVHKRRGIGTNREEG